MLALNFPINATSLGSSAFHILENVDREFCLFPVGGGVDVSAFEPLNQELKEKISKGMLLGLRNHDINNLSIRLWHHFASHERISKRQILYTFHEVNQLTKLEVNCLNQQEAIIVPCNYNKSVFELAQVKPKVHVVPLGIDSNVFRPLEKNKNKTGPFVFAMAGKFEARKLHMETLQAFVQLFANNPNVRLRCCIHNRFVDMRAVFQLINERVFFGQQIKNIEFIDWLPTERHFADFLGDADCLISPSRAESFNLPLLQAMACGTHVITNADHAHGDYVTPANATIIKSEGMVPARDDAFFRDDGNTNTGLWYNVNINSIANAMVQVVNAGRSINSNGIETAKRFTWQNTAQEILKIWDSHKT